ncbi:hypothetical protein Tco_0770271 [Tanacetum coccineum]|uniref:Uncharacterized protein n=1 Tax=Tanacetum coccineum TaxID=301880 RepID=A0ABQ4ZCT8_9ASTR
MVSYNHHPSHMRKTLKRMKKYTRGLKTFLTSIERGESREQRGRGEGIPEERGRRGGREESTKKKKERSLDYNNSFLGEDECSSLAHNREDKRDEKEEIGSLETSSNNGSSLRYETGEEKLNEVDLISQRVEMISSIPTTMTKAWLKFNLSIGFLEKFGGGFEQDIDDEGEEDKEDEEGDGQV